LIAAAERAEREQHRKREWARLNRAHLAEYHRRWRDRSTLDGWINDTFSSIRGRCTGHASTAAARRMYTDMPFMSLARFRAWMLKPEQQSAWRACVDTAAVTGKRGDRPSVDRINPQRGYVARNLRIVSLRENAKGAAGRRRQPAKAPL
jgi:hypothetical protein